MTHDTNIKCSTFCDFFDDTPSMTFNNTTSGSIFNSTSDLTSGKKIYFRLLVENKIAHRVRNFIVKCITLFPIASSFEQKKMKIKSFKHINE